MHLLFMQLSTSCSTNSALVLHKKPSHPIWDAFKPAGGPHDKNPTDSAFNRWGCGLNPTNLNDYAIMPA